MHELQGEKFLKGSEPPVLVVGGLMKQESADVSKGVVVTDAGSEKATAEKQEVARDAVKKGAAEIGRDRNQVYPIDGR